MTGILLGWGQPEAGADPKAWTDVLRHDVAPTLAAFLVYVSILRAHARSAGGVERDGVPRRPELVSYLASTATGGLLAFAVILLIFYLGLGGEPARSVARGLGEGLVLLFAVVVPGFLLLSLGQRVWASRGRPAPADAKQPNR